MNLNRKKYYLPSNRFEENVKRYIHNWFSLEDNYRCNNSMAHISTQDAYNRMLDELSSIEDRFYHDIDVRKHKIDPTRYDWKRFAIVEIINIMDVIYNTEQYCQLHDEELRMVDEKYSGLDERSVKYALCTPATAKIRIQCAAKIWHEWSNERHWGPRVGVILISTMETGAEKVLLVSYIKDNVFHYGFPKGKPNLGETIRTGAFREFKEETGIDELILSFQLNEKDGVVIKKYPHIGPIHRRRSRTHYYVITTTPTQLTSFRPDRNEIHDIEWHSIYTLPCCNHCKIKRTFIFVNGSDIPVNYHMVTMRDIHGKNTSILEISAYTDAKNGNRDAYNKYRYTHRSCGDNLS